MKREVHCTHKILYPTRPSKQCKFCDYLLDRPLISQDFQSGPIDQSSPAGPSIKVASFMICIKKIVLFVVCCLLFVVGHCLLLVIVCHWSLFVVGHCLSSAVVCHWSFFVVGHCCRWSLCVIGRILLLVVVCRCMLFVVV